MQKYGVIFDLDGTLWDVTDTTVYSANEIARKYGLPEVSKAAVVNSFGLPKEGSAKNFFPDLPLEKSLPYVDEIISQNIDNLFLRGGYLYPDLADMLEVINRKYALFIVTNSPKKRYAESFIVTSDTAKYFCDYCSAGELGLTKAEAIAKIVSDNKLDAAVYVGDTVMDRISAKEAGIGFIYADYGFGQIEDAEFTISALNELPAALERAFNKQNS